MQEKDILLPQIYFHLKFEQSQKWGKATGGTCATGSQSNRGAALSVHLQAKHTALLFTPPGSAKYLVFVKR